MQGGTKSSSDGREGGFTWLLCLGAGGRELPQGDPCSRCFRAVFDVKTRLVAPKGIIIREAGLTLICRALVNFGSLAPLSFL